MGGGFSRLESATDSNVYRAINSKSACLEQLNDKSEKIILPSQITAKNGRVYNITKLLTGSISEFPQKSFSFAPDSKVQIIESYAFKESDSGKGRSLVLPLSLKKLKDSALGGVVLHNVEISSDNKFYRVSEDRILYNLYPLKIEYCPRNTRHVTIRRNITIIANNCFSFCPLTVIHIPASVMRIGCSAFEGCTNLSRVSFDKKSQLKLIDCNAFAMTKISKIMIPSNVQVIEKKAFYCCLYLKKLVFVSPSRLVDIGEYAFSRTQIRVVNFPKSLRRLRNWVFWNCPNLTTFTHPDSHYLLVSRDVFSPKTLDEQSQKLFDRLFHESALAPEFIKSQVSMR